MKHSFPLLALAVASAFVMACSGDDAVVTPANDSGADTKVGDAPVDTATDTPTDTPSTPPPPTLGAQIDRMGRPAINTALNHAFDIDETAKGTAKDGYNTDKAIAGWSKYVPEFEKNLAILDAIDGNCGNQAFVDKTATGPERYKTLAGVLADDRLWVKTAATTCTTYLAVEADATKLLVNGDCGGRKPEYEVMKETYSLLAIGAIGGVTDGTTPAAKSKVAAFPYLAPPP